MAEKHAQKPTKQSAAKKKPSANGRASKRAKQEIEHVSDAERPPASFRGLMPTPPEVQKMLDEMYRERPFSESFRRLQTDYLNEQYYFGGNPIAYRDTPQGREILAVGWDEIDQLESKRMSRRERHSIVLGFAEPW